MSSKESTKTSEAVFDEFNLDAVISFIKSEKAKNIITLAGAGLSTSAGIPDFRSPESGLYHKLSKYNLPEPTAIFSLEYFHHDPKPFFSLAKDLYPGTFKPTKSHYFIRLLNEQGLLLRHYTQNIDSLERIAGVPEDKVIYAHGNFYTGHCVQCKIQYDLKFMKKAIFNDEVPVCEKESCDGVVKPDIVMFGESLPSRFITSVSDDFKKCDLLIIMGTSLTVMPFASLIERVSSKVPRLYINQTYEDDSDLESGVLSKLANLFIGSSTGLRYGKSDNIRDVFVRGDCDSTCEKIIQQLGWHEKFNKFYSLEIKKLDEHLAKKEDLAELCSDGKL